MSKSYTPLALSLVLIAFTSFWLDALYSNSIQKNHISAQSAQQSFTHHIVKNTKNETLNAEPFGLNDDLNEMNIMHQIAQEIKRGQKHENKKTQNVNLKDKGQFVALKQPCTIFNHKNSQVGKTVSEKAIWIEPFSQKYWKINLKSGEGLIHSNCIASNGFRL